MLRTTVMLDHRIESGAVGVPQSSREAFGARMPKEYIGTAGWTIPRRVANHFAAEGSALVRYATRFSAAEINSTFHRSHQPQTFARWATSMGEEFRFAIKLPKAISHGLRLVGAEALLKTFLEEIRNLGSKTGPFLLQLPPSLNYDRYVAEKFFGFLRKRSAQKIVCEPRHPSWFDPEAENLLASFNIARVAADPARVPEAGRPGGDRTLEYYRLHGSPRMYYSAYGSSFLSELANTISQSHAEEVWCIFDNTCPEQQQKTRWRF
jgi:uncharacterized protein YecE (DUF72 family)